MFTGIISSSNLLSLHHKAGTKLGSLIKRKPFAITPNDSLKHAVEIMAKENLDVLPVVQETDRSTVGILTYKDVLSAYRSQSHEHKESVALSLKRRSLKMLVHGKKRLAVLKGKEE
ncbi:MAG: CBS domain-containing protein [Williamsia sp.]|nr:CBS domain-containing protein [Williamsia sp.]